MKYFIYNNSEVFVRSIHNKYFIQLRTYLLGRFLQQLSFLLRDVS